MDSKIVMLLIGIVAIGMFALPSTLAMYSGQHTFTGGADVDCNKCHGDGDSIANELNTAGAPHYNKSCKDCHGFSSSINPSINPNNPDTKGHAASTTILCLDCHADTSGVPGTAIDGNGMEISDELAAGAHAPFAAGFAGANDACLGCHTAAPITANIGAPVANETLDLHAFNY